MKLLFFAIKTFYLKIVPNVPNLPVLFYALLLSLFIFFIPYYKSIEYIVKNSIVYPSVLNGVGTSAKKSSQKVPSDEKSSHYTLYFSIIYAMAM
jgi:hypothetical protein